VINLSQPIKKIKNKLREVYYDTYFYVEGVLHQHVVPLLWYDTSHVLIKAGDLVQLKHKLTLNKYHGIILDKPFKVITAYGIIGISDNIRYVVPVRWNYGSKVYTRHEFCDNLEIISGGK
tara:strand:- start:11989 stop:12348 length:360 start_codon:yes stop_codon:yes gene_type:complete